MPGWAIALLVVAAIAVAYFVLRGVGRKRSKARLAETWTAPSPRPFEEDGPFPGSSFPPLAGPNVSVPPQPEPGATAMPCEERLLIDGVAMTPANPYFTKKAGVAITLTVEGCALPPDMEKRARDAIRIDNKSSPKEGTPEVTLAVKKRTGRQPDGTTLPGLPANIPSAGSEHLTLSSSQSGLEPRRAWAVQAQGPALIKLAALVWEALKPTMKFTPVVRGTKEIPAYISVTFQPGRANLDGTPTIAGRIFIE